MVRTATRGLVESFGYNVETFDSAEAFLGSEWPRKAYCLIADVRMPGMSGPDLRKHLVNSGIDIPVIFITAFPNRALRERVLKAGAVAYLCHDRHLLSPAECSQAGPPDRSPACQAARIWSLLHFMSSVPDVRTR